MPGADTNHHRKANARKILRLAARLLGVFALLVASVRWSSDAAPAAETNLVRIGLLLPPEEPQSRSVREGVALAQEQARQRATAPLDIVIRGRVGQWGADGVEAARLVTDDGVSGLIAPPDGAASHLTLQVSGRTAVPVITLCPDSSVGRTGVPWTLRIVPRTVEEAAALFNGLGTGTSGHTNRWLALVPTGRAGREISLDLTQAALGCGMRLDFILESDASKTDPHSLSAEVLRHKPDVVLVWLAPAMAGNMVRNLKVAGYRGVLAGPERLHCADFMEQAGDALDGFIVPSLAFPGEGAPGESFQNAFQKRWGHAPDLMASISYDAAVLLNELLRRPDFQTPPHRLAPDFSWPGVTGDLRFDREGNRAVKLELWRAHGHRFMPLSKTD